MTTKSQYEKSPLERFEEKCIPEPMSGCWIWLVYLDRKGYGIFRPESKSKMIYAHKFSYLHYRGPIPIGLQLDHLCRNRSCVNPFHLEPVTGKENCLRGFGPTAINARKTHCIQGHLLEDANIYLEKPYGRKCRICRQKRKKEFEVRKHWKRGETGELQL